MYYKRKRCEGWEAMAMVILSYALCLSLGAFIGFLCAGLCAAASDGDQDRPPEEERGCEISCRETLYNPCWTQDERQS